MKIEYLPNTDPVHPKDAIFRVFDFNSSEACQFRDILVGLSNGSVSEVHMKELPFIAVAGECHLVLKVGSMDAGIVTRSGTDFECVLKRNTWKNAACLVEPFCEEELSGHQWLYDLDTDIEFLFSPSGDW